MAKNLKFQIWVKNQGINFIFCNLAPTNWHLREVEEWRVEDNPMQPRRPGAVFNHRRYEQFAAYVREISSDEDITDKQLATLLIVKTVEIFQNK